MLYLRSLFFVLCMFGCKATFGQLTNYLFKDVYSITLPNIVELQNSELNTLNTIKSKEGKSAIKIYSLSNKIVFQQKGLNDEQKSAYNKYCRVMIEYFEEGKNAPVYGIGDKIDIDKDVLYAVEQSSKESCRKSGTPFIKLISLESININEFPVLYYSYKRKGWEGKEPLVIVNVYQIFNRYNRVNLIFSYREAERESWKGIHNNIIKSFRFNSKY